MGAYVKFWKPEDVFLTEDVFLKMCSGEVYDTMLDVEFAEPVVEGCYTPFFIIKTFGKHPGVVAFCDLDELSTNESTSMQLACLCMDCIVDTDYMPHVSVDDLREQIPGVDWTGKSGDLALHGETAEKLLMIWHRYFYAHRNEIFDENQSHARNICTHFFGYDSLDDYFNRVRSGACEICGYDYSKLPLATEVRNKLLIYYAPEDEKNLSIDDFDKHVHFVCPACVKGGSHNESKCRELLKEPTSLLGLPTAFADRPKTYVMFWDSDENSFDKDDFYELFEEVEDPETDAPMLDWAFEDGEDVEMYDRFFLVRLDGDNPGIVAAGHVNQGTWHDTDWNFDDALVAPLVIECALDSDYLPHISIEQLESEMPDFDWRHGHRGRRLPKEYAWKLELIWSRFLYANRRAIRNAEGRAKLRYTDVYAIANLNKCFAQTRGCKCEVCGHDYSQLWSGDDENIVDNYMVFWSSLDAENLRPEDFDKHAHCVCPNCYRIGQSQLAKFFGETGYAVLSDEDYDWGRTWSEDV